MSEGHRDQAAGGVELAAGATHVGGRSGPPWPDQGCDDDLMAHLLLTRLLPGNRPCARRLAGLLCGRLSLYLEVVKALSLLLCHFIAVDTRPPNMWPWYTGVAVLAISVSQLLLLDTRVAIQLTLAFELHFVAVRVTLTRTQTAPAACRTDPGGVVCAGELHGPRLLYVLAIPRRRKRGGGEGGGDSLLS